MSFSSLQLFRQHLVQFLHFFDHQMPRAFDPDVGPGLVAPQYFILRTMNMKRGRRHFVAFPVQDLPDGPACEGDGGALDGIAQHLFAFGIFRPEQPIGKCRWAFHHSRRNKARQLQPSQYAVIKWKVGTALDAREHDDQFGLCHFCDLDANNAAERQASEKKGL